MGSFFVYSSVHIISSILDLIVEFDVLVSLRNRTIQTKCQKYLLINSAMELSLKDSQYVACLVFM